VKAIKRSESKEDAGLRPHNQSNSESSKTVRNGNKIHHPTVMSPQMRFLSNGR